LPGESLAGAALAVYMSQPGAGQRNPFAPIVLRVTGEAIAEALAGLAGADGSRQLKVTSGSFTVGPLGFGDGDGRGVLGYRFEELDDASHVPAARGGSAAGETFARGRTNVLQYGTVNEQVFHCRTEAAHARRGTVTAGTITAGIVWAGDPADLDHAGWTRAVSYRGVEFAGDLRRSRQLPPLTGLLIPGLEPSDVWAGDKLTCPGMSD
jgi:hypothetical protein